MMTEADWLAADDPDALLAFLADRLSRRKLILFACACLRAVPFKATDRKTRHAVEVIERFANGLVPVEAVAGLPLKFQETWSSSPLGWPHAIMPAFGIMHAISQLATGLSDESAVPADLMETIRLASQTVRPQSPRGPAAQARSFREVSGNPFRPVAFDLAWRTSAVVGLAEAIQADRGFDRLPILADALEDAGCADADVLAHFRGPGTHVRGCWALDLVLGKA